MIDDKHLEDDFIIQLYADDFCFPVGTKDTLGYYNAQQFNSSSDHLGEDWNALTGGDTDLGDPIYVCANGYVKEAKDFKGGWGNVIRVLHFLQNDTIESLYAHCDKMTVEKGDWIRKGTEIGTIGNAHGKYKAHLHFEMRSDISLPLGKGYSREKNGYIHPTAYILSHRK